MTTRKFYTDRYNELATQLGRPTVNCLFKTLPIAKARAETLEIEVAHGAKAVPPTLGPVSEMLCPTHQELTTDVGTSMKTETKTEPEGIPTFLRVENRKPLTLEQETRLQEITHAAGTRQRRRKRDFYQPKGMPDEEWKALKRAKEEEEEEAAKKARLADMRASRTSSAVSTGRTTPKKARAEHDDACMIVALVKGNPHRPTAKDHDKWEKTMAAGIVGKAIAAGVEIGYIRYAAGRGLLRVDPPATKK